jgi:hypothetical protein
MEHAMGCTCCNDGYIDDLLKRKPPKPTPRRRQLSLRQINEYLCCKLPKADQLRMVGIPSKKELWNMEPSRRNFLRAMVVGAGGLLAFYSGLLRNPKARAGQCTGDPTWDVTCLLGTGYFLNCDEWGARPPNGSLYVYNHAPSYFAVHHTATANTNDFSQQAAISLAHGIQNYHMDYNGWIDTGQHFTNSRGAWILEGRHTSIWNEFLADYDAHLEGTHVAYFNDVAMGLENEGTYTYEYPPNWQTAQLINIATTAAWYNYPIWSWTTLGHRDFPYNYTECPGDKLYSLLPCIRAWMSYYVEGGGYPGNCY